MKFNANLFLHGKIKFTYHFQFRDYNCFMDFDNTGTLDLVLAAAR